MNGYRKLRASSLPLLVFGLWLALPADCLAQGVAVIVTKKFKDEKQSNVTLGSLRGFCCAFTSGDSSCRTDLPGVRGGQIREVQIPRDGWKGREVVQFAIYNGRPIEEILATAEISGPRVEIPQADISLEAILDRVRSNESVIALIWLERDRSGRILIGDRRDRLVLPEDLDYLTVSGLDPFDDRYPLRGERLQGGNRSGK